MAYEIILPRDTQDDIVAFIQHRYVGQAAEMAAANALEAEMERLGVNPGLGVVSVGTPFVLHGFREVPQPLL